MTTVIDTPAPHTDAEPADPGQEQAQQWARDYADRISQASSGRLSQLGGSRNGSSGAVHPNIGEPTTDGVYVAFDVAATSPIQFTGPPPYQPSKIIAAGETAYLVAFGWVNPVSSTPYGFLVPPAVQLGGRTWQMTLDLADITQGTVSTLTQTGTFSSPADELTLVVFTLPTPDPGADPAVYEANVTFNVVSPAQPYAAFATAFIDVDSDPGFLFVPPVPPGWRRDLPNRYLVYDD